MDAALGLTDKLTVMGTTHPTRDGSCVRDFIHVVDLVDAHIKLMGRLSNPPVLFNVGTGKGVSVKEIVAACLKVTGKNITVVMQVRCTVLLSLSLSLSQSANLFFFAREVNSPGVAQEKD